MAHAVYGAVCALAHDVVGHLDAAHAVVVVVATLEGGHGWSCMCVLGIDGLMGGLEWMRVSGAV